MRNVDDLDNLLFFVVDRASNSLNSAKFLGLDDNFFGSRFFSGLYTIIELKIVTYLLLGSRFLF